MEDWHHLHCGSDPTPLLYFLGDQDITQKADPIYHVWAEGDLSPYFMNMLDIS